MPESTLPQPLQDRITIAGFSFVLVLVLAFAYGLGRIGFDTPLMPILKAVLLAGMLLGGPIIASLAITRFWPGRPQTGLLSGAGLTLLGVALVVLAGLIGQIAGVSLYPLLALIGLAAVGLLAVRFWAGGRWWHSLVLLAIAAFLGVFFVVEVWGRGYQSPLYLEGVVASASGHRDTFFHASISAMLRTHGIPSIGLDGPVEVAYHYGSHWVLAAFSSVLDSSALHFYLRDYPIIFLPFLVYCLLLAGLDLRALFAAPGAPYRPLHRDYWHWLLLLVILLGIPAVVKGAHLQSESYVLGRAALALLIALSAEAIDRIGAKRAAPTPADWLLIGLVLPALLMLVGLLKASIMVLAALALAYVLLRWQLYRRAVFVVGVLVFVGLFLLLYPSGYEAPHVEDESTLREQVSQLIGQLAVLEHLFPFLFSWAYIFLRLAPARMQPLSELLARWRRRDLLDVEVVLLLSVVSTGALLFVHLGGGAEVYIYDVQRWIVLVLFLAVVPGILPTRWDISLARFPRNLRVKDALLAAGVLFLLSGWVGVLAVKAVNTVKVNTRIRRAILDDPSIPTLTMFRMDIEPALAQEEGYGLLHTLEALAALPAEEKQRVLLYIPRENPYWQMTVAQARTAVCSTIPMLAPSLTGIAQLDGIPSPECTIDAPGYRKYYGPYYTGEVFAPSLPAAAGQAALCEAAGQRGFAAVWVLEADYTTTRVSCEAGP